MGDVIYITICLGTGFFFGVFATIIGIVVLSDYQIEKEKRSRDDKSKAKKE